MDSQEFMLSQNNYELNRLNNFNSLRSTSSDSNLCDYKLLDSNQHPNASHQINYSCVLPPKISNLPVSAHEQNPQNGPLPKKSKSKANKKKKNNNVIKKIGRIINNHMNKEETNEGISKMFQRLRSEMVSKKKKTDMMDIFNTYHLDTFLNQCQEEIGSYNLKMFFNLLKKHLREEVLGSYQLKEQGKLMYLNTLKVNQLRCCNKKLASRLTTGSVDSQEESQSQDEVVQDVVVNDELGDNGLNEVIPLPHGDNSLQEQIRSIIQKE